MVDVTGLLIVLRRTHNRASAIPRSLRDIVYTTLRSPELFGDSTRVCSVAMLGIGCGSRPVTSGLVLDAVAERLKVEPGVGREGGESVCLPA